MNNSHSQPSTPNPHTPNPHTPNPHTPQPSTIRELNDGDIGSWHIPPQKVPRRYKVDGVCQSTKWNGRGSCQASSKCRGMRISTRQEQRGTKRGDWSVSGSVQALHDPTHDFETNGHILRRRSYRFHSSTDPLPTRRTRAFSFAVSNRLAYCKLCQE